MSHNLNYFRPDTFHLSGLVGRRCRAAFADEQMSSPLRPRETAQQRRPTMGLKPRRGAAHLIRSVSLALPAVAIRTVVCVRVRGTRVRSQIALPQSRQNGLLVVTIAVGVNHYSEHVRPIRRELCLKIARKVG